MKSQAYESAPLPIDMDWNRYGNGKLTYAYVLDRNYGREMELGDAMNYLLSEDKENSIMKKTIAIILAAVLLLACSACAALSPKVALTGEWKLETADIASEASITGTLNATLTVNEDKTFTLSMSSESTIRASIAESSCRFRGSESRLRVSGFCIKPPLMI